MYGLMYGVLDKMVWKEVESVICGDVSFGFLFVWDDFVGRRGDFWWRSGWCEWFLVNVRYLIKDELLSEVIVYVSWVFLMFNL